MKEVLNSVRVAVPNWLDETAFSALLAFLDEYRDCMQHIAFFSSDFHPPQPLATAEKHSAVLADRIRRARAAGFSCGINILSTVGHHPERRDECLHGPWRHMTNIDGEACEGRFCPADERYREEYVKPLYEIYCAAGPEFLWIDDDIRYGHIPIGNGCFCDGCLAAFNAAHGCVYTRETLKKALTSPANTALRKQWLDAQSGKIASLLAFIRATVNACDDGITLGFMTGERYFEGYDFARWAAALSQNGKYEIMWRPGGGAYTDRPLGGLLEKARQIGRQCAALPPYVRPVQSEIENFPYRLLQKSPRSMALEVLLHTAAGCTGAALNILPDAPKREAPDVMRGHFDALRRALPFERLLSSTLGRAPTVGIYDGRSGYGQAALDADFLHGSGGGFPAAWDELFSLGLPACHSFETAACYLLAGNAPVSFSEEELLHMLSKGVYMDAAALAALERLGFGDYTGFKVGEEFREDSVEVYAPHPLNAGFAGKTRLCPQVFVQGSSAALLPAAGAEVLCYLEDFHGRQKAACSMGIYKNQLGGTVCVGAHYARCGFLDTLKSRQMKRIFRALSGDTLPFLADSCVRIEAAARQTETGPAVVLMNPNLDVLENAEILFPGDVPALTFIPENGAKTVLPARGPDGRMTRFRLPPLAPYTLAMITRDPSRDFM